MPDFPNNDDAVSTAGWDAITASLQRLYSGQEPRHWGTLLGFSIGGPDPLDGISAYLRDDGSGASHWHFVTFGMSELYAKEWENKAISGWGFEFTFRLRRDPAKNEPPQWPLGLLQNLARYVFNSGNVFAPGHYLPLNGPIALETETAIHAAVFAEDAELGAIEGPNGSVRFLQLVGITMQELAAARAWNADKLLTLMRPTNPLLVTDLARQTITDDPTIAAAIAQGTARDGSSTGYFAVRELSIVEGSESPGKRSLTMIIGASGVGDIRALLRGRISFGREFRLVGPNNIVTFSPSNRVGWEDNRDEKTTKINLPMRIAESLAASLRPIRGDYATPEAPELIVRVVPSKIMDHMGKIVVEVIG